MKRLLFALSIVFVWFGWSSSAFASLSIVGGGFAFSDVHFGAPVGLTQGVRTSLGADETYTSITIVGQNGTTNAECNQITFLPAGGQTVEPVTTDTVTATFTATIRSATALDCLATFRNGGTAIGTFTVTGRGVAPIATVTTSTPVDFGSIRVSTGLPATLTKNVVIQNTGNAPLQIDTAAIPASDYQFSSLPSLPTTINPGNTFTMGVIFDPTASGTRTAAITVTSEDPSPGSTAVPNNVINLTGVGGNARIHVSNSTDTASMIDFAIAPNGVNKIVQALVKNDAPTNKMGLIISNATIVPDTLGSTWFSFATNGGFACTAGSKNCSFAQTLTTQFSIDVICNPNPSTAFGTQTATLTVNSDTDPSGANSSVQLSCTAGRSDMVITPTTLAFGDQRVGTDSVSQTFTITNSGNVNGTFSISKSGDGTEFVISGCASPVAASNGVATCTVTFHPTSLGDKVATFTITTNDPDPGDNSRTITPVTGRGVAPQITGPASVDFASVDLGSSSGAVALTITNTGTSDLSITGASVSLNGAVYSIMSGLTGAQTVAANGTATWMLVCTPANQNANAGQFRILSDSTTNATLNVPLACNGQRGLFVTSTTPATVPTTVDFGAVPQGMPVMKTFTLTNSGNLSITGISGMIMQTAGQGYSFDPITQTTLVAGGSTSVTVRFLPPDGNAGGDASLVVTGMWNGTAAHTIMTTVILKGDGLSEGVDISPSSGLDYGSFRWDSPKSLAFCVVNSSQFAVAINDISIMNMSGTLMNEFTVTGLKRQTTCHTGGSGMSVPGTLAPNEILEVTITATPMSRIGGLGATVTVTTGLMTNPTRTITLTGMSTSGSVVITPGMDVDLGAVDVDTGPVTQTITITNNGAADIDLASFAGTPPASIVLALPANTTLTPGMAATIGITYDPTIVATDAVTVTGGLQHIVNGPTMATFTIHGRGIDRLFAADPTDATFPATFKNPGTDAPILVVQVKNNGEAPLHVTGAMIDGTGAPQFALVDNPVFTVPGNSMMDVHVRYTPTMANQTSDADLIFTNDDDMMAMGKITLHGMGLGRNVGLSMMGTFDVGYTAVGIPVRVDGLAITSMDTTSMFTIRAFELADTDGPFTIVGAPLGTSDPKTVDQGIALPPAGTQPFEVEFAADSEGMFATTATLYLDQDPEPQGMITLTGTAVIADLRGGGGCSTSGGGAGGGAIIAIGAALAMRRRRRAALVAAILAVPTIAAADGDPHNLDVGVFNPTPTTISGTWNVQTADVGKDGDWVAGAMVSYASKPLVIDFASLGTAELIGTRTMYELGGAYAFLDRFEAGLRMPLYSQSGSTDLMVPSPDGQLHGITGTQAKGTARGDLVLHGKARLVDTNFLSLGAGLAVTLPTATDGQYTGVDLPTVRILALASFVPNKRITLTANLGGVIREKSEAALITQKSGLAYGASLTFRALDKLWIAGEIFGEMVPSGQAEAGTSGSSMKTQSSLSPIEGLLGITYRVERRITVGLAAGRGISNSIGAPALRGVFSITFAPGLPELKPIHPPPPPKIDGDADGDGIKDSKDKCDNEPEDKDNFQDDDGCPDPDNDNDGVADANDKCPLDPEDRDKFQDTDGCPDKDNDNDGIADDRDKCPDKPEDKDGFQDTDGCPDLDNDNDGIPDDKDKCVDQPETINGISDDDGCPDKGDSVVVVSPDRLETLEAIMFSAGTAKITKPSFNVLGQVAATLRAHPEIIRVRVTTHVNPSGNATKDQELTEKRAAAVREWLIQWGIASSRLDARGFGGTKTLVPSTQTGASAVNERLELIILERK